MVEIKRHQINGNTYLTQLSDESFKTIRISINMIVPLEEDSVSCFALLPSILTSSSKAFPDYTSFKKKLEDLYGANLDSNVTKRGRYQILTLTATGISSRYAFAHEDMAKELSNLLLSSLFEPNLDNMGNFSLDTFQQEQRQSIEQLDAEFSDKMLYAAQQCQKFFFDGSAESLNPYGIKEQVASLELEKVSKALETLRQQARFEIFILGDCEFDINTYKEAFKAVGKAQTFALRDTIKTTDVINYVTEDMPLAQSKLVMAFDAPVSMDKRPIYTVMNTIFGGSASAKLFRNVREKMSLCYYCYSRLDIQNGLMTVESGVETDSIEKASDAIIDQFNEVRAGNITDEEIEFAKLSICNSYRSVRDSLQSIESWYLTQAFYDKMETPDMIAERIWAVTKDEIVAAAKTIRLDTVYALKGVAEENRQID